MVNGVQLPTRVVTLTEGSGGVPPGLPGALPPSLRDLGPSLTLLELPDNAITSVPTELGALTGLMALRLGFNAITAVPTEIGALAGLEELWLQENDLTSVPTELAALTGLRYLNLAANGFDSLPTELGALTGLTSLNLGSNAITSVPTELAALTGLETLALEDNQVTGVPTAFRTVNPSNCYLFYNPGFSCANVGAGTTCCTGATEFGNYCGEGLSGGPCYTG